MTGLEIDSHARRLYYTALVFFTPFGMKDAPAWSDLSAHDKDRFRDAVISAAKTNEPPKVVLSPEEYRLRLYVLFAALLVVLSACFLVAKFV